MPFTPFHMGPGLLIKAVLQGAFSLMVFGWAQIVMDIQPLVTVWALQAFAPAFDLPHFRPPSGGPAGIICPI